MFDYYLIDEELICNNCGYKHMEYQGKDGPCGLFVFKIQHKEPIEQRVDDEWKINETDVCLITLPAEFCIYGICDCGCQITLQCKTNGDGKWISYEHANSIQN